MTASPYVRAVRRRRRAERAGFWALATAAAGLMLGLSLALDAGLARVFAP